MTTYAQFVQKGALQGKIEGKIEILWKFWRKGFAAELMIDLTDLTEATVKTWINRFETLQKCRIDKKAVAETAKLTQLTEQQVTDWYTFIGKAEHSMKS
jgi:hypothetical protein